MEINSQPDRMDLKDVHARLARERGVRMVIDTDSHSTKQLDHIRYGVFTARRAGLTRDDVLNTLPYEAFMEQRRRPGNAPARGVPRPAAPAKAAPARAPATSTAVKARAGRSPARVTSPRKAKKTPARGKKR
jgi:hypothetical protein